MPKLMSANELSVKFIKTTIDINNMAFLYPLVIAPYAYKRGLDHYTIKGFREHKGISCIKLVCEFICNIFLCHLHPHSRGIPETLFS